MTSPHDPLAASLLAALGAMRSALSGQVLPERIATATGATEGVGPVGQRGLEHSLEGPAAEVFNILDAAYPDFDAGYRMD